ncbi:MAG: arginine deiminase [Oscillospiraceae bacterium]|nr:arginine deiminase [Oscillospiraceae bacterium]
MLIHATDEISPLKKVLLHRPGSELEQLTPQSLIPLLFDDIPYLKAAQFEHDYFAELLRKNGVEVLYLEDLIASTISQAPEIKKQFIQEFIDEAGAIAKHHEARLTEMLLSMDNEKELILSTMAGINVKKLQGRNSGSFVDMISRTTQFAIEPIPNLYFTRDPFAIIGNGVSLNHMYSYTRNRETIYSRYIFKYHPEFNGKIPFYYTNDEPYSIEGGDILNLNENTIAIGLSQRTCPEACELLAQNIFSDETSKVNTILAFDIPSLRTYMHLDTVFTQVDVSKFIVHPLILDYLDIYILKKGSGKDLIVEKSDLNLRATLQKVLNLDDCTLIYCGGKDQISSAREQWNDGANTLCIAKGVVITYDRNTITNQTLRENGITVLTTLSSELSRGRGGPHCMSMPLVRSSL